MKEYLLYFYHIETGEYLFKKEPQNHPNGQPILDVLGATHTKPPQAKGNRIPKWTGNQGY